LPHSIYLKALVVEEVVEVVEAVEVAYRDIDRTH
tara:strand:+ start:275 stop:376 length:102 start_codon:yes stop_codon:yes gene_type:complete